MTEPKNPPAPSASEKSDYDELFDASFADDKDGDFMHDQWAEPLDAQTEQVSLSDLEQEMQNRASPEPYEPVGEKRKKVMIGGDDADKLFGVLPRRLLFPIGAVAGALAFVGVMVSLQLGMDGAPTNAVAPDISGISSAAPTPEQADAVPALPPTAAEGPVDPAAAVPEQGLPVAGETYPLPEFMAAAPPAADASAQQLTTQSTIPDAVVSAETVPVPAPQAEAVPAGTAPTEAASVDLASDAPLFPETAAADNVELPAAPAADAAIVTSAADTSAPAVAETVPGPQAAAAPMEDRLAPLEEKLATLEARLEQVVQGLEASNARLAEVQQQNLGAALPTEMADTEALRTDLRSLTRKLERLEEKVANTAPVSAAVTKAPAAAPASSAAGTLGQLTQTPPPASAIAAPPRRALGLSLRAATPGVAWIAPAGQPNAIRRVVPGDQVDGLGQILAIRQENGQWRVIGSQAVLP